MKRKMLPSVIGLLLVVGSSVAVNAAVLCANPSGSVFVRAQCKANEQQFNPGAPGPGLQVIFRDVQRSNVTLGPGDELSVAAGCDVGEVVISGGYITDPSDPLRVTLNAPFFDGLNSGWLVDFLNASDTTATVSVRVNVSCTSGTGIGE